MSLSPSPPIHYHSPFRYSHFRVFLFVCPGWRYTASLCLIPDFIVITTRPLASIPPCELQVCQPASQLYNIQQHHQRLGKARQQNHLAAAAASVRKGQSPTSPTSPSVVAVAAAAEVWKGAACRTCSSYSSWWEMEMVYCLKRNRFTV